MTSRKAKNHKASLVRHPISWLLVTLGCQLGCHSMQGGRAPLEAQLPAVSRPLNASDRVSESVAEVQVHRGSSAGNTTRKASGNLNPASKKEHVIQEAGTDQDDAAHDTGDTETDVITHLSLPPPPAVLADSGKNNATDTVDDEEESNEEFDDGSVDSSLADDADTGADVWCADSVYLKDWEKTFSKNWMAENASKFKGRGSQKRLQAAQREARSEAYMKLLLPHLNNQSFDFPVVINREVLNWIQYFQTRGRSHFVTWLRRGQDLIPKMVPVLRDHGLPTDLVYLAMIESGFNNRAYSFAAAAGTWQFIRGTARRYGLRIDDYVDSRKDPAKATLAASSYLKELYLLLGDWHLAAASYNAGEGRIIRAQKRVPDGDFWTLSEQGLLPKETRQYVPKMIAAMIISKNPETFGFEVAEGSRALSYKFLSVERSIALKDLAAAVKVDMQVLENLNPELRTGIVPPPNDKWGGVYAIRVPTSVYDEAKDAVADLPESPRTVRLVAKVGRAQTLSQFAVRTGMRPNDLLKSNPGFKLSTRLRRGQSVSLMVQLGSGVLDKVSASEKVKRKAGKKRVRRYASRRA